MKEEEPEILKDYTFIKDIGEGNFGKVKLSVLNDTQQQYAIKILDKKKLKAQTKTSSFNEIEIISKLKHPNIINVEKILEDENNYYIIMEYCENGELYEYIVNKDRLDEEESSIFFYQLINGVEYIHKQGFAHRDLKPENLLLTKNNKLKIIDFGLCHDFDGTKLLKSKCGSPSYAAPEILKDHPYDGFKTDIWCCGIILYGMACGYLPFDGEDNIEIFNQIIKCKPEFPSFLGDDCINLLMGILTSKPKKRLSINQIKKHPFYLKARNYYINKYNEELEVEEEEDIKIINNNISDKKNYAYTSIKKNQEDISTFNKNKTSKVKKEKNFKNNIYQNIFDNIVYDDEDEKNININNKEEDILSKNKDKEDKEKDKESEKYDKAKKRKINEIAGLINNMKNLNQNEEEDKNNVKPSLILRTFKNKFKKKKLKLNLNKLHIFNDKVNDSLNEKLTIFDYHSNSNPKTNEIKNKNGLSLDINILNDKSLDKKTYEKPIMKFDKKIFKKNNIKELKLKTEKLDFFQKFLINKRKNQIENLEKSPIRNNGINFNLILSKTKERIKSENKKNVDIDFKELNQLTIKKNKLKEQNRIIFTEKRKKIDSSNKKIILHSEINLDSSPNSIRNITKKYHLDKYYSFIYGTNNEEGCHTFSIKKRKNIKINKNFNLKITNLNTKGNIIKKEARNKYVLSFPNDKKEKENIIDMIMNKKNINLNGVLKTEPKYNHFLDEVIKKINSNQNKKVIKNNINLLNFNNKYKNDEKMKMIKILNREKNKEIGCPYLIKYYKHNSKEEKTNKMPQLTLKEDKKNFLSINPKILENSKEKIKRRFPNFSKYNKNN